MDEQFKTIVLHPNLRQSGIKSEGDLPDFTDGQKRFVIQLSCQIGQYVNSTDGRHTPQTLLAEAGLPWGVHE